MAKTTGDDGSTESNPSNNVKARFSDQRVGLGGGGETHQTAGENTRAMTTNQGVPIADNQNSLTAGARGPTLLEDFVLREKIFHEDISAPRPRDGA